MKISLSISLVYKKLNVSTNMTKADHAPPWKYKKLDSSPTEQDLW